MLLIIELIFLVAGLWALISARLPEGLFRLLFGKGDYKLPPDRARLYGLLLASPLPMSLFVSFLLAALFGGRSAGTAVAFEYVYFLAVVLSSIVIARRIRHGVEQEPKELIADAGNLQETRSYGTRLLIVAGLAVITVITLISIGTLGLTIFSIINYGVSVTGDFSQDFLPFILTIVISGLGLFGIYKLLRLLRE